MRDLRAIVNALSRRPVLVVRAGLGLTVALLLLLLWIGRDAHRVLAGIHANAVSFEEMVRASTLDDQLTRSARMSAVTRDSAWVRLDALAGTGMDTLTHLFLRGAHRVGEHQAAVQLREANERLRGIEDEVHALALAGQQDAALRLLSSEEYNRQKERFSRALTQITAGFSRQVQADEEVFGRTMRLVVMVATGGVLLLLGLWLVALTLIRRHIAERTRAEEGERQLVEEQAARTMAERANRAKNEFLSRMSHELRTPLNAILGFGQLLESDSAIKDQESVEQILKAGRHLLSLIDEVLDIAKIEAGRMSLSVEPVSVAEVLREALSLVRHLAAQHGVALDLGELLETRQFVAADRQRLKQVLLNLLSNAIKYNRAAGTVTVTCRATEPGRVRIAVRDTGYGIPSDRLARLFTPFERLDVERNGVQGTGLGLALSRGLVEAMGGQLGVESVEGEGSTFWVELAGAAQEGIPEPPPAAAGGAREEAVEQTHTVLLIEDNLANVRLMERILARRPHVRLLTSMQARLGLELARERRPDLILLDLNLPDISGMEVLQRLQQDPELRPIPVVMVSADAVPGRVEHLKSLGARAYITKPFDMPHLLQVVDENLNGKQDRST